jgi:hypothetical protein
MEMNEDKEERNLWGEGVLNFEFKVEENCTLLSCYCTKLAISSERSDPPEDSNKIQYKTLLL